MSFTQLNPPIPVEVIGMGSAMAIAVIDYGPDHNLIWVSAMIGSGEIWCAPNAVVRVEAPWVFGRHRGVSEHVPCSCEVTSAEHAHQTRPAF
ncbi:MAG: hypothetical protein ABIQ66_09870 [Novosphingobium sp.]